MDPTSQAVPPTASTYMDRAAVYGKNVIDAVVKPCKWYDRKIVDITKALPRVPQIISRAALRALPYIALQCTLPTWAFVAALGTIAIIKAIDTEKDKEPDLTPITNTAGVMVVISGLQNLVQQGAWNVLCGAGKLLGSGIFFFTSGLIPDLLQLERKQTKTPPITEEVPTTTETPEGDDNTTAADIVQVADTTENTKQPPSENDID